MKKSRSSWFSKIIRQWKEYFIIRKSGYFDPAYYLLHNPDVRKADVDPLWHFINYGWREGRSPNSWFETNYYLDSNPDIKKSDANPLVHYIQFGQKEGRQPSPGTLFPSESTNRSGQRTKVQRYIYRSLRRIFDILPNRYQWRFIFWLYQHLSFLFDKSLTITTLLNTLFPISGGTDDKGGRKPLFSILTYSAHFFHSPKDKAYDQDPLTQEIDIIIPVYNGIEYLARLFDCLLRNTDPPFRVIIVDDNSTDPDVISFLDKLTHQNSNILLLRNEENKGFVRSINYAANFVRNHFVILNTDVEVPKRWLQRLMKPILNRPKVASTTPFTNAGTICSFPVPLVDNSLFGNLSSDVIDSVFKQVDASTVSIALPTGVGFCMGVNLEAWKQIGPFDEERFGRGYGEENDWCMRASLAGYKNLAIPNLFVYHKHGGSFSSEEKQKLAWENLQKLNRLHPNYQELVNNFIANDPLQPIRKFASLCLMGPASSDKTILIIDHEYGGGANAYRKQLVENHLKIGQAVLLLTYDVQKRSIKLRALFQNYEEIFYVLRVDDLFILPKYLQIGEIFYNNMVSFGKALDMVSAIYHLKMVTGAKLTVAVHDYYMLCPSYNLLNYEGQYCDLPSIETCRKCLPINRFRNRNDPEDILKWRQEWFALLDKAEKIICFSESSERLLKKIYNLEHKYISIQPHKPLIQFEKKPRVFFEYPLSIGVVGGIDYAKGANMVVEVAKILLEYDPSIKITVIGILYPPAQLPNITITGQYDLSELPDMLEQHKINLCFFPSICPETFSYVTSELMDLKMPICAFNLGAQAERIKSYPLGYIISKIDAKVAASEMLEFFARLKQSVSAKP